MEFRERGTQDIFDGADTEAARKTLPRDLWPNAQGKLDRLRRAASDPKCFPRIGGMKRAITATTIPDPRMMPILVWYVSALA